MTQQNVFAALCTAREDAVFLRLPDGNAITYGGMRSRTARFANCLSRAGVRAGERVAVQTGKCADALFLYFACMRAGAIYLPLNPAYTPAEMAYFLGDAEPACVVVAPEKLAPLKPLRPEAHFFTLGAGDSGSLAGRAAEMPDSFADVVSGSDDLAAILYTSGTTGRSKGAMLTHGNLVSNALALRDLWNFASADVLLHALPIYHTHGLFTATNTIVAAGASMILLPKFDLDDFFAQLPHATAMMGVPTFYTRLLADARLDRESVSHMRLFVSGSAPLLAESHRAWRARTGHAVLERYGMTETNMIASNPYAGERRPGAVGFPLRDVQVRITNPASGENFCSGEIGSIEVAGPNVFKGYWRNPEKTREAFRDDGFFVTGDLGCFDENNYLHIVGRAKDLVISGGFNVYPLEVENEIDALAGVLESAVIGLPHSDLGEAVTALVVRKSGARIGEGEILSAIAGRLARFKHPRRVLFVDALPRNAMGKVQKAALRQAHSKLYFTH